jgi:imidazolonepropionase
VRVELSPSVSINHAAQVLRPPQSGLTHLRHDRAGELVADGGSLSISDGRIAAFAPDATATVQIDATGCAALPGFVDCHTHLPFAGWRAAEYEMKVTGVPYEQIARSGGGIRASSRALAETDDAHVLEQARGLAAEMLATGTTTLEGKSGYGLSIPAEQRALRLAAVLAGRIPQTATSTALLAHAVPDGHDADSWLALVDGNLEAVLAAGDPTALDIYVESVAFTNAHLVHMGELARRGGLDLRAHVEQFNPNRSVPVALQAGARSVDHLSRLHPDDIAPLAAAECAAVLLPGAEFLGGEHVPPARELADAGAICALATDCNPGTSPITSMPVIIGLAVRRYGWSAREALLAATLNAAWVLRVSEVTGSLEVGKRADVILLDGPIEELAYRFGRNPVVCVLIGGEVVYERTGGRSRVSA